MYDSNCVCLFVPCAVFNNLLLFKILFTFANIGSKNKKKTLENRV